MNNLALVHIELGEYNFALDYINKALDLRTEYNLNPVDILHSYKSLSELYFIWNMQDKGNLYLFKTDSANNLIQKQITEKSENWDDITYKLSENYVGNCYEYKGEYLFRQKMFDQALSAYNSASFYYGDFTFQKVSLLNKKANVFYMLSEYENCLKVIEECILLSKEQNLQNEEEKALELKIKVLNKLGLSSEIDVTVEEILKNKDYRYSVQIDQLLSGLESKNEILIKKAEIKVEKEKTSRIVFMSIIVILILAFATAYFLSRKVYLDKQMIIANQNEKIAKSELEHKKRELAAISTNIVQENEQVSNILKDLKYYSSLVKEENDKNLFSPLIKSISRILSEKRKENLYSDQFNAAYPGYLEYLTRTFTELTTADLKLCTFLRMNLNTKEIADIMGLSVRSVESRRYRLRKKLNLSKDDDLVSNLISLNY
jgi:DNA-binding CsgD family transcriptional regulator/tetratricopeptide (TPR) repeat protein